MQRLPTLFSTGNMPAFLASRRRFLAGLPIAALAGGLLPSPAQAAGLGFPRDHGVHTDFDIEWWYLTGYLYPAVAQPSQSPPTGFQITFFRKRIDSTQRLAQRLAAKHLVFAHAAITMPASDGRPAAFFHDQRLARWNGQSPPRDDGRSPVFVSDTHMAVRLGTGATAWRFDTQDIAARGRSAFKASVTTQGFALALDVRPTQNTVLQGQQGLSQKGPDPRSTSWYTTDPQLALTGDLTVSDRTTKGMTGVAWLDHEWSQGFMPPDAVGWDWIGMNFDNGAALTAFQLRDRAGHAVWTGGSWRSGPNDTVRSFGPGDLQWSPQGIWKSPTTGISYPITWRIETPQGVFTVAPIAPNQELDSRATTGTIYWEGLSALRDNSGRRVAWGYLEMTGYGDPLTI